MNEDMRIQGILATRGLEQLEREVDEATRHLAVCAHHVQVYTRMIQRELQESGRRKSIEHLSTN